MRRTKADWRKLIEQQQNSGLSAAQFCRDHSINPKYFSTRKQALFDSGMSFVQVTPSHEESIASTSSGSLVNVRVIEFDVPNDTLLDSLSLLLSRR